MARKAAIARRLPGGRYAYRGVAVAFSDLPKRERGRFQAVWAGKAARTRTARAEALAGVPGVPGPVVEVSTAKGEKRGVRTLRKNYPGEAPAAIRSALIETAKASPTGTERGGWVAVIEWPDDPRSKPGKPFTTRASRSYFEAGDFKRGAEASKNFFREIVRSDGRNLDPKKGGSGAKGKPVIKAIEFLAAKRPKKVKTERRERPSKAAVRRERIEEAVRAAQSRMAAIEAERPANIRAAMLADEEGGE